MGTASLAGGLLLVFLGAWLIVRTWWGGLGHQLAVKVGASSDEPATDAGAQ